MKIVSFSGKLVQFTPQPGKDNDKTAPKNKNKSQGDVFEVRNNVINLNFLEDPLDDKYQSIESHLEWLKSANVFLKKDSSRVEKVSSNLYDLLRSQKMIDVLQRAKADGKDNQVRKFFDNVMMLTERLDYLNAPQEDVELVSGLVMVLEESYEQGELNIVNAEETDKMFFSDEMEQESHTKISLEDVSQTLSQNATAEEKEEIQKALKEMMDMIIDPEDEQIVDFSIKLDKKFNSGNYMQALEMILKLIEQRRNNNDDNED